MGARGKPNWVKERKRRQRRKDRLLTSTPSPVAVEPGSLRAIAAEVAAEEAKKSMSRMEEV